MSMEKKDLAEEYSIKEYERVNGNSDPIFEDNRCFSFDDIEAAFNAGCESVVENIPELEWVETTYDLQDYFLSHNNGWSYSIFFRDGAFQVHVNCSYIGQYILLAAAKQAANEDYKKRIKQALGL